MKLHPEILMKDGIKQFAILPYEEFVALQERLADAEDLLELRKAKWNAEKDFLPFIRITRFVFSPKGIHTTAQGKRSATLGSPNPPNDYSEGVR